MRYKNNIVFLMLILCLLIQICTAGENEYGVVKAWCNNQPATVESINLKINEPVEIRIEVTSKIDGFIDLKLKEPGVTNAYSVVSGPSEMGEWITEENVQSGWSNNYTWVITPTGEWTSGSAPVNILVYFFKEINDDLSIQFTIANPTILDEHYSGPAPTRTTTDPSSTNQSPSQGSPGFGVAGALLGILLAVVYRAGRA